MLFHRYLLRGIIGNSSASLGAGCSHACIIGLPVQVHTYRHFASVIHLQPVLPTRLTMDRLIFPRQCRRSRGHVFILSSRRGWVTPAHPSNASDQAQSTQKHVQTHDSIFIYFLLLELAQGFYLIDRRFSDGCDRWLILLVSVQGLVRHLGSISIPERTTCFRLFFVHFLHFTDASDCNFRVLVVEGGCGGKVSYIPESYFKDSK